MTTRRVGGSTTTHRVVLYGTIEEGDRLRSTRQIIKVIDAGTGAGSALATALDCATPPVDVAQPESREGHGCTPELSEPLALPDTTIELNLNDDVNQVDTSLPWSIGTSTREIAGLPDAVLSGMTRHRLDAAETPPRFHAAMAVDRSGRAVVIVGRSGAGKSTLIAHLVDAGLDLANDEQVTIHHRHGVLGGFTRPVAIKPGGVAYLPTRVQERLGPGDGDDARTRLVTVEALGGRQRLVGRPVLIVLPERPRPPDPDRPDDETTADERSVSIIRLTPGQAAEALCANNLDLVRKPTEGLEAFGWLAATTPVIRLPYESAAEAADQIMAALEDLPDPSPVPWIVHDAETLVGHGDVSIRPAPEVVALEVGHETLLMHTMTRQLALLNPAGGEVWRDLPAAMRSDDEELCTFLAALEAEGFIETGQPEAATIADIPAGRPKQP